LLDLLFVRPLLCYMEYDHHHLHELVILELHSKQYFEEFLADEYEYGIEKAKYRNFKDDIFSSFDDSETDAGKVPTGSATVQEYLEIKTKSAVRQHYLWMFH
jgi:hypothetical protein